MADADADRAIFVVDAQRDHRALEARIGHSRHRQQQLAGQETSVASTTARQWAAATRRARLEAAVRPSLSAAFNPHREENIHDHPSRRPPARRAADHRHRRRPAADHQRRIFRAASGWRCLRCPARSRRPARPATCRPMSRRRRSSKARASTRSPAFPSTTPSSWRPGASATAQSDITMLADGNGAFRRRGRARHGRQQVRHGQALAALFDDRQRRRRRAAQRRSPGRISRVQRRDICSISSRPPDSSPPLAALLTAVRSKARNSARSQIV